MSQGPVTLSEWQEQEYNRAAGLLVRGGGITVSTLFLLWIMHLSLQPGPTLTVSLICMGVGAAIGIGFMGAGLAKIAAAKRRSFINVRCPYCESENHLVMQPRSNFNCEKCRRTIHYENGAMAPVKTIVCDGCGAQHRVWAGAETYVCEKCNKRLDVNPRQAPAEPVVQPGTQARRQAGMMLGGAHQTVVLTGYDATREDQLALMLQRELRVQNPEARAMLQSVSVQSPLIVAYDVPADEAEPLARQLQQLGGQVRMDTV